MFDVSIDWHKPRTRTQLARLIEHKNLQTLQGRGIEHHGRNQWSVDGDYAVVRWDPDNPFEWSGAAVVAKYLDVTTEAIRLWRRQGTLEQHGIDVYEVDSFDVIVPRGQDVPRHHLYKLRFERS